MATSYVQAIRKMQPHGPYFLGGYCMGGTVAFEMAQQLKAQKEEVALLVLLDTVNWSKLPQLTLWGRAYDAAEWLGFHAANFMLLTFSEKLRFSREKLKILKSRLSVWKGMLLAKFVASGRGHSEARLLAEMWAVNERAGVEYVPKPYDGLISEFRPLKQYRKNSSPQARWSELSLQGCEVVTLPVYPAGMLLEPFVQKLATALQNSIDQASKHSQCQATTTQESTLRNSRR